MGFEPNTVHLTENEPCELRVSVAPTALEHRSFHSHPVLLKWTVLALNQALYFCLALFPFCVLCVTIRQNSSRFAKDLSAQPNCATG